MAQAVRMIDIAREAGVSGAVVSKVLGNASKLNIRVSPETEKRVREIAERLNYTPNINARALAGQSSKLIGVLLDSQSPTVRFRLMAALEREIARCGYRTLVGEMHEDFESLCSHYRLFQQYGVDGVICLSHDYPGMNQQVGEFFKNKRNVVFYGYPEVYDLPYVVLDLERGIADAVRYLQNSGRRRIGISLTNPQDDTSILARRRGFLSVQPEAEELIYTFDVNRFDSEDMRAQTRRMIDEFIVPRKLDALISTNDYYAMILLNELAKDGIRIPDDIALVGHDNEFFGECCTPQLATIDENAALCAEALVDVLLNSIFHKTKETHKIITPRLLVRQSAAKKGN